MEIKQMDNETLVGFYYTYKNRMYLVGLGKYQFQNDNFDEETFYMRYNLITDEMKERGIEVEKGYGYIAWCYTTNDVFHHKEFESFYLALRYVAQHYEKDCRLLPNVEKKSRRIKEFGIFRLKEGFMPMLLAKSPTNTPQIMKLPNDWKQSLTNFI